MILQGYYPVWSQCCSQEAQTSHDMLHSKKDAQTCQYTDTYTHQHYFTYLSPAIFCDRVKHNLY